MAVITRPNEAEKRFGARSVGLNLTLNILTSNPLSRLSGLNFPLLKARKVKSIKRNKIIGQYPVNK